MIVAVLQARVSSSRLPGKVLKPILDVPMLAHQIERVKRARKIDHLVVATSTQAEDAAIVALCGTTPSYRGSLDDVLDRCFHAVNAFRPTYVVRLTGDCPLTDWNVIDQAIAFCVDGNFDYVSNGLRPTWPDGLDVEVARFSAFREAWREAQLPSEREHVMPFLHRRPERYRLGSFEQDEDFSHLRWTVDEPRDFDFVSEVYNALYPENAAFDTSDVLALMRRRPKLNRLNANLIRNEGMQKSLIADDDFLASRRR